MLTRTEEIILLAVHALAADAYGNAIRRQIADKTGIQYSIGAIYVPLERMHKRGLLTVREGAPTAVRGGRRTRCYALTADGLRALQQVQNLQQRLWQGVNLAASA